MKVLVWGATGGTGRLIVWDALGERPFRRGHGSAASADLPEIDMIAGNARDEGTLTCSLVVTGAESPRLMHDPEAVSLMQLVDFSRVQESTYCRTV